MDERTFPNYFSRHQRVLTHNHMRNYTNGTTGTMPCSAQPSLSVLQAGYVWACGSQPWPRPFVPMMLGAAPSVLDFLSTNQ